MNTELIHIQHQISSAKLPSSPKTAIDCKILWILERLLGQISLLENRVMELEEEGKTDGGY